MNKIPPLIQEQSSAEQVPLAEQLERLNFIVNQTPALIGYWDNYLINQFSNAAYSRWFGQSPEEIKGKHLREILGDALYKSLSSEIDGVMHGKEQRYERHFTDANTGEKIHTLTRYVPDIDKGQVKGFCVLGVDITEVKQLELLAYDALQRGLDADEFELYYQPQANMRTGKVLGFEALIRWNKNQSELEEPARFLPLIQNTVLGVELGWWVMKSALAQLAQWHAQGLDTTLSINVDARQLQLPQFVIKLEAELNTFSHFKPGSLIIEILETTPIDDRAKVTEVINHCRALGVEFDLDDFGTGYSSIAYLRELPIKTLKIDRSFITDITHSDYNQKLVVNIIRLANDIDKQVIAEGVETIEQGELLIKLGCEVGQGYAIAKPMPVDKVLPWLREWQPDTAWQSSTLCRLASTKSLSLS